MHASAAYSAPIYYVGQPRAIRMSQSPPAAAAWLKPSPILTSMPLPYAARRRSRSPSRTPSPPPSPTARADVPTAVSTLLGLTKQLQDTLRLWALREASEAQVSDAFVLVGMQFNATCAAFARCGVDMSDLFPIPDDLRAVLEACLGEDPCPRALERYMPKVRTVLYRLLQGLQRKQAPYWRAVEPVPSSRWDSRWEGR